ncbi:MAG TPA: orotidine-5'-phosphate decarboxylase [Solirubrobacterales bacterium]|nr:orotidine-5'-phosphate decarboxylase [Solirubrobacterales bacterium]
MNFGDRVAGAVRARESHLLLGLDPDPADLLPAAARAAAGDSPAELAATAVAAHCRALIDAAGEACAGVKLQLACFERLGAPGAAALAAVAAHARGAGLLVVADGKRGDVPHTAAAYAQSLLGATETPWGTVPGLGADAVTANPLLGRDALEPLVTAARAAGAGVFVLVRTSNPGAAEIQDVSPGGGPPLRDRLAALVAELGADGVGDEGLSDVGAVVAATEPSLLAALRERMPQAVFLLPGVGAQGGRVEDLAPAFGGHLAGALITVSRTIARAALDAGDAAAARPAAEEIRAAAWAAAA